MSEDHINDQRNYAGPVARAYELSREPLTVIEGPTGGGKTQASARKCHRVALWQHPSPKRNLRKVEYRGKPTWIGERRGKITVVAPTYPVLWDTAIPSYQKVFDTSWKCQDGSGGWKGAEGRLAEHIFELATPDGGKLHIEVDFRAINDDDVEDFMKGRESTAFWIPELTTHPAENLLSKALNRVGRYPEPDDRWDPDEAASLGWEPAYKGVFGDTNSPVIGSWFHDRFYVRRDNRRGYYRQPPAILEDGTQNPNAENLHNLRKISPTYYADLAAVQDEYDNARFLMCKPGWSLNGKPVYLHFDDDRHVSKALLEPDPNLPLIIGIDAGNTLKPAAIFMQRSYSGQVRVLDEICPGEGQLDIEEFAREVRRKKDTRFAMCLRAEGYVDPSAKAKMTNNRQISYAQLLARETRLAIRLAPTNDPKLRRAAANKLMRTSAGPREPALIIDPSCTGYIKACGGGFRYKKVGNVYSPEPEKNEHSHPAEAGEYGFLGLEGVGAFGGGFIPPAHGVAHNGPGVILD